MFDDLIKKNRSYRAFDHKVVLTKENLTKMIECARYSPSARNQQAIKFKLILGKSASDMGGLYKLGGALPELNLPAKGTEPTAFILVTIDSNLAKKDDKYTIMDVGIISHSILLKATDMGFGGIMIGAANFDKIKQVLELDDRYIPMLLLGLGKPSENIIVKDISDKSSRKYYREDSVHIVPKVNAEELIL